jgi:hypothetical protein
MEVGLIGDVAHRETLKGSVLDAPVRHSQISGLEQRALMSAWGSKTMVGSIWGYFDESGEHGPNGKLKRLTLGGFFAPRPEIRSLCERWRNALDKEGLSDFHMCEIASDEHDFENWPANRQERLRRFVDILCDHAMYFGAYSYKVTSKSNAFVQAYKPALNRVLIELENLCIQDGVRGNIVFVHTTEISNELIGCFFDGANWSGWFNSYGVQRSSNEPALQAAEIVARGMKQLMQDGTITNSFARIVTTGKLVRFWPPEPLAALSVPLRMGPR